MILVVRGREFEKHSLKIFKQNDFKEKKKRLDQEKPAAIKQFDLGICVWQNEEERRQQKFSQ